METSQVSTTSWPGGCKPVDANFLSSTTQEWFIALGLRDINVKLCRFLPVWQFSTICSYCPVPPFCIVAVPVWDLCIVESALWPMSPACILMNRGSLAPSPPMWDKLTRTSNFTVLGYKSTDQNENWSPLLAIQLGDKAFTLWKL